MEGEKQLELNRKLDSTNKAIFVDDDNAEKKKMKDLKEKLQAAEQELADARDVADGVLEPGSRR